MDSSGSERGEYTHPLAAIGDAGELFRGAGAIAGLFAHCQSSLGLEEESEGVYPMSAGLEVASARTHQMWWSVGSQQGPAPAATKDGARAPAPLPTPLLQALQAREGSTTPFHRVLESRDKASPL